MTDTITAYNLGDNTVTANYDTHGRCVHCRGHGIICRDTGQPPEEQLRAHGWEVKNRLTCPQCRKDQPVRVTLTIEREYTEDEEGRRLTGGTVAYRAAYNGRVAITTSDLPVKTWRPDPPALLALLMILARQDPYCLQSAMDKERIQREVYEIHMPELMDQLEIRHLQNHLTINYEWELAL